MNALSLPESQFLSALSFSAFKAFIAASPTCIVPLRLTKTAIGIESLRVLLRIITGTPTSIFEMEADVVPIYMP